MQFLRLKRTYKSQYLAFVLAFVLVTYYFGKYTALSTKGSTSDEDSNEFLEVSKILNDPKTTSTPSSLVINDLKPEELALINKGQKTKAIYLDSWVRSASGSCKGKKSGLVLVVVISAPGNVRQRRAIRESWGGVAAKAKHSAIVYLVGRPKEEGGLEGLKRESDEFGDLIVTDNIDTYHNLTLKTLAAFSWTKKFCPKADFILKTDDDMFVQVKRLLFTVRGLRKAAVGQKLIVGNLASGWEPVRNPQSKYFITEGQFSGVRYPPFVTGPSYLVSRQAADLIFEASMDMPFFHLEDVFLTGIVAEEVNVPRRMATEFRNNANPIPAPFLGCTLLRTISIHKIKPEDQAELLSMSRNPSCGKGPPSQVL